MNKNTNFDFGLDVLNRFRKIREDMKIAGEDGVVSLIAACIYSGTDDHFEILEIIEEIGGIGFFDEAVSVLSHGADNRPWTQFPALRYSLKAA